MINPLAINHKFLLLILFLSTKSQQPEIKNKEIDFVSDTQQPLAIEKIRLKANHNTKATSLIFSEIIKNNPQAVYLLGDITGLDRATANGKQ